MLAELIKPKVAKQQSPTTLANKPKAALAAIYLKNLKIFLVGGTSFELVTPAV